MSEYNLNFFEAMAALKKGETVTNDLGVGYIYKSIDGNLKASLINTENYWFYSKLDIPEIAAKWRIVEPEKCWLETYNAMSMDKGVKDCMKELAHEAIKRIEAHYNHLNNTTAVEVLRDLIGEK
jgi:hypothetical protein